MTARTHLIRSDYWGSWHRRTVDAEGKEHATGYTDDILCAGIFTEAFAMSYDDGGKPGARDRAVLLAEARKELEQAAEQARLRMVKAEEVLALFDAMKKGEGL